MAIIETRHAQPGPSMTAPPPDLYDVLGLAPSATQDQVRHAYLDLVRRHHPDLRTAQQPAQEPRHAATREPAASDEVLRQVLAAYAVLGDRGRRARYDNDRHRAGTWQPSSAKTQNLISRIQKYSFLRRSALQLIVGLQIGSEVGQPLGPAKEGLSGSSS